MSRQRRARCRGVPLSDPVSLDFANVPADNQLKAAIELLA